jgi:phenylacetate-CoA ligase
MISNANTMLLGVNDYARALTLYPFVKASVHAAELRLNNPEAIQATSNLLLEKLLRFSLTRIPFYRKIAHLLDLDLNRDGAFTCFKSLPRLDRELLQEAVEAKVMFGDLGPCCEFRTTSGTTGRPLIVPRCWRALVADNADLALRLQIMGLSPHFRPSFARSSFVYVSDTEYRPAFRNYSRRIPLLGWAMFRKFDLRTSQPGDVPVLVSRIADANPVILTGKPSSLEILADYQEQYSDFSIRPKLIISGAEHLNVSLRRRLERLFLAPVRESYGLTEAGTLAVECPNGIGMHLAEDRYIVEIHDSDGQSLPVGVSGEIVVTDLRNYALPLLRYRTGDVGRILHDRCPCGIAHRRLQLLDGRLVDYFKRADGTSVNAFRLSAGLTTLPIRQFQIIQVSLTEILVRYVGEPDEVKVEDAMRADVDSCFGTHVSLTIRHEAERLNVPGQKFRPFRCDIV